MPLYLFAKKNDKPNFIFFKFQDTLSPKESKLVPRKIIYYCALYSESKSEKNTESNIVSNLAPNYFDLKIFQKHPIPISFQTFCKVHTKIFFENVSRLNLV